eukprot:TRINITY_DN2849_c0_g3_i2.p1 TRINITY_DN2849_c0_g3~~TRINITY_DN2849_c0_g3_i2.p1  ORF type:complete len:283 (+),score=47.55 TRINITY_DN2849_c0_g3_i2:2082-2930(+)
MCVDDRMVAAPTFAKAASAIAPKRPQPAAVAASTAETERMPSSTAASAETPVKSCPAIDAASTSISAAELTWAKTRAELAKTAPSFKLGRPAPTDEQPLTPGVIQVSPERADSRTAVSQSLQPGNGGSGVGSNAGGGGGGSTSKCDGGVDEHGSQLGSIAPSKFAGWLFRGEDTEPRQEELQFPAMSMAARARRHGLSPQDYANLLELDIANRLRAPTELTALHHLEKLLEEARCMLQPSSEIIDVWNTMVDSTLSTCTLLLHAARSIAPAECRSCVSSLSR